uniref:Uncharacterized protein n=1 Tax=Dictyoglomus turgidum TaxID=513050 RepID=A0A7C3SNL3_9BACT
MEQEENLLSEILRSAGIGLAIYTYVPLIIYLIYILSELNLSLFGIILLVSNKVFSKYVDTGKFLYLMLTIISIPVYIALIVRIVRIFISIF